MRIFDEVQPGEPQHLPAEKRDLVSLSIMLEGGLIIVKHPAVGLDSDLGRWKGDVDFISADGGVVLGEVDTSGAALPTPGSHPPGRGRLTYAGSTGLSQRKDTVVLTEILVEHLIRTVRPPRPVPIQ